MRLFQSIFFYLLCFSYLLSDNSKHVLNQHEEPIEIHIIEQNKDYIIINYKINNYSISNYNYNGY